MALADTPNRTKTREKPRTNMRAGPSTLDLEAAPGPLLLSLRAGAGARQKPDVRGQQREDARKTTTAPLLRKLPTAAPSAPRSLPPAWLHGHNVKARVHVNDFAGMPLLAGLRRKRAVSAISAVVTLRRSGARSA